MENTSHDPVVPIRHCDANDPMSSIPPIYTPTAVSASEIGSGLVRAAAAIGSGLVRASNLADASDICVYFNVERFNALAKQICEKSASAKPSVDQCDQPDIGATIEHVLKRRKAKSITRLGVPVPADDTVHRDDPTIINWRSMLSQSFVMEDMLVVLLSRNSVMKPAAARRESILIGFDVGANICNMSSLETTTFWSLDDCSQRVAERAAENYVAIHSVMKYGQPACSGDSACSARQPMQPPFGDFSSSTDKQRPRQPGNIADTKACQQSKIHAAAGTSLESDASAAGSTEVLDATLIGDIAMHNNITTAATGIKVGDAAPSTMASQQTQVVKQAAHQDTSTPVISVPIVMPTPIKSNEGAVAATPVAIATVATAAPIVTSAPVPSPGNTVNNAGAALEASPKASLPSDVPKAAVTTSKVDGRSFSNVVRQKKYTTSESKQCVDTKKPAAQCTLEQVVVDTAATQRDMKRIECPFKAYCCYGSTCRFWHSDEDYKIFKENNGHGILMTKARKCIHGDHCHYPDCKFWHTKDPICCLWCKSNEHLTCWCPVFAAKIANHHMVVYGDDQFTELNTNLQRAATGNEGWPVLPVIIPMQISSAAVTRPNLQPAGLPAVVATAASPAANATASASPIAEATVASAGTPIPQVASASVANISPSKAVAAPVATSEVSPSTAYKGAEPAEQFSRVVGHKKHKKKHRNQHGTSVDELFADPSV